MSGHQLIVAVVCVLAVASSSIFAYADEATSTTTTTTATTTTTTTTTTSDKVKLGVYMESLCPDTRRFFLGQLVPTQRAIGQVLDLRIVPFGHARTLGNNRMVCQHGSRECEGNRRMACLLARSKNQNELVETFGCIFRQEQDVKTCVGKHMAQVNFDELEKCTTGDESYQLMVLAEKETGKINYVPHLTVNGQASEEIQDGAEHRLTEFLCKQYKGQETLDACKGFAANGNAHAQ